MLENTLKLEQWQKNASAFRDVKLKQITASGLTEHIRDLLVEKARDLQKRLQQMRGRIRKRLGEFERIYQGVTRLIPSGLHLWLIVVIEGQQRDIHLRYLLDKCVVYTPTSMLYRYVFMMDIYTGYIVR